MTVLRSPLRKVLRPPLRSPLVRRFGGAARPLPSQLHGVFHVTLRLNCTAYMDSITYRIETT